MNTHHFASLFLSTLAKYRLMIALHPNTPACVAAKYQTAKAALAENGLSFTEDMVAICTLDKEDTIEAVNKLPAQRPDAFFITNDFAAAAGIEELHKKGIRVPEDIAVFGFNNDVPGSLITPKLSTIDYPGIEVGVIAAKELMQLMKSKHKKLVSKTVLVPSEMIVRESSRKKK